MRSGAAEDRDSLTIAHARARPGLARRLDWIPNWYCANHRVAYWDMFGWPEQKPDYGFPVETMWWFDEDKAASNWQRLSISVPPDGRRPLMGAYILRRILLMIPTMFGIMAISFAVVQFAPGGPVEQVIAKLHGQATLGDRASAAAAAIAGGGSSVDAGGEVSSKYRGAQGLDPGIHQQAGKAVRLRQAAARALRRRCCGTMPASISARAIFRDISVLDLILEKMPVSISLGLWITLLSYADLDPARHPQGGQGRLDLRRLDVSGVIIVGYAIPGFLFAILLIVLFAGGCFFDWFPLRGLTSENFDQLSWSQKILDYFWHLALPLTAMVLSAFATTTLLTKNSFLDEIRKQYVMTARAKGLTRAAGALRPRLPQRHADRHRRLSRRLHLGLLHRLAADREHLLARRPRPARLPLGAQPRLSGGVRQPLHLLAARPGRQPDLRPDLHLDRSAHRFRAEGRLMAQILAEARSRRHAAAGRRAALAVAAQPAALAEFQGQPARLLVAVDLPRAVRAVAVCRVHRQRQADRRLLQGRDPVSGAASTTPKRSSAASYAVTDYRDPVIQDEIKANGWMIWPPIRYSYQHRQRRHSRSRPRPSRPGC